MDKNYIVKKSNYFIMNCSYDLSLEEQKLILTLSSMVQPADEEFKPYKFKISDFIKLLGVETQTKYTEIPKITKELMKKVFEIEENDELIQIAWLSSAKYKKGSGMVELEFSPKLKPYMLQLKEKFTQYQLANILSMKSKYSPRIYEILKCNEFKKQKCLEIEVNELRKLLKAENIYPKYNDFKRYILERTRKELNKISDITYEFEEIKTGRKITKIKFYIKSKNLVNSISENNSPNEVNIISTNENTDVKALVELMNDHNISYKEAESIYTSSKGDISHIIKVYNYLKNKPADNFVGLMISQVKPGVFNEPKKNYGKNSFNNFEPREYDYDNLEKKLLGWE